MNPASLEIAVDSPGFAAEAAPFADRLELCSDLEQEGFSPSRSLMTRTLDAVSDHGTPIHALVRPLPAGRSGPPRLEDFVLDASLLQRSLDHVSLAGDLGLQGVVIGAATPAGRPDLDACSLLCERARRYGLEVGFHRAFDLLVDRPAALADLAAIGIRRVLSTGGAGWVPAPGSHHERAGRLRALAEHAASLAGHDPRVALDVVTCGGIRSGSPPQLLRATGHLHSSGGRTPEGRLEEVMGLSLLVTSMKLG
ncbi:MAG: copper homeostasis protein CutC [Planctomycetota bacterium]|nr:copper homeostasis protein CutC [Planctomycetota bacterium]